MNYSGSVIIEAGPVGSSPVNSLQLPVNPNQQIDQDIRVTFVQTYAGIYFDDFGLGIEQITLTGTSAWNSPQGMFNGQAVDGNDAIFHLYSDIFAYYFGKETSNVSPSNMEMSIYDDAVGQAWVVKPVTSLQLMRSNSSPLVVGYTANFVVTNNMMYGPPSTPAPDPVQQTVAAAPAAAPTAAKKTAVAAAKKTTKQPSYYTVQSGNNLWDIAKGYLGVSASNSAIQTLVNSIVSTNKIKTPNLIFPGQRLVIPA